MNGLVENIEHDLCRALCSEISLRQLDGGDFFVSTPFSFPDGDAYSLYLKRLHTGGYRISDMGSTMMSLSYDHDVSKFEEGSRGRVFNQILAEMNVNNNDGEIYLEIPAHELANGMFTFGQALTRIHDLTFLNRVQVESTFMDDLKDYLKSVVGEDRLIEDSIPEDVPYAENYKADFAVKGKSMPVLIWGINNGYKARLATIVMQHLQKNNFLFKSLVVYSDMASIPMPDVARLTTAANDQIPSLDEKTPLKNKLLQAIA